MKKWYLFFIAFLGASCSVRANLIVATPANYTSLISSLNAGDTLLLTAGIYTNNLTLNGKNGTALKPIVIMGMGNTTVIRGNACCNTVSITKCSYLTLSYFKLDGMNQFVDGVKAEGTAGNWAHHITVEHLTITNYYKDQQQVGISTKCPAWNWIIRSNIINGSGTGLYLGNSDGTRPFVIGIIENNLVENTIGYNMEIKHQLNGVRDSFPGTMVNGFTIIRNNVFTKDSATSSTGANARPNLLVGGFPTSGWGSLDYYDIYGNFIYNNPVEALFQGTGNIHIYANVLVNHYNPAGFRAVYITPQNGVSPQEVEVFHNTVWAANSSGGIRLLSPDTNYSQYCYANAVFSPLPITNFKDTAGNITDAYGNAGLYVLSATTALSSLDLYPKSSKLTGMLIAGSHFNHDVDWDQDFNKNLYDWTYRGAYSGCCTNSGWKLSIDTMPFSRGTVTVLPGFVLNGKAEAFVDASLHLLHVRLNGILRAEIKVFDLQGKLMVEKSAFYGDNQIDVSAFNNGVFIIVVMGDGRVLFKDKIVVVD